MFSAWDEFKQGKRRRMDILQFEKNLEQEIFKLHRHLKNKAYVHDPYADFYIHDPKRRHVHKATVRDRILHHTVFKILNPIYEPTFIARSFSCRIGKGTHKGILAMEYMIGKISKNNTHSCYVLKCDIRKFFDTIDHGVLLGILRRKIKDDETTWLLEKIVGSFTSGYADLFSPKGVPIGNLTSQLFANVYMNEFDQFMKHELKVEYYARYTDDFIVVSDDEGYLENLIGRISLFLRSSLKLALHPGKVSITKYGQGVDFLGYVAFPHHKQIRKRTWRRILRKFEERISMHKNGSITKENLDQTIQSYLGVLSHGDSYRKSQDLKNMYLFLMGK